MNMLISWLILSAAIWLTTLILPGIRIKGFLSAFWISIIFGLLSFFLGWLLFSVFTIATLGIAYLLAFITRWIINALLLYLTSKLTKSLEIDRFSWALVGAAVISIIGTGLEWLILGSS